MKFSILLALSLFSFMAQAAQTTTDCPAMNGNREKIIKTQTKNSVKTQQAVGQ